MKFLIPVLAAVVLLLAGAKGITIRKDMAAERQAIDADWTQVDAALEQRSAVIGEIAEMVQAEAPREVRAIADLDAARRALGQAHSLREKIQANTRLDDAVARLMLQVEGYPKIENSERYRGFLDNLKDAEYQIAVTRRKYNEAVEHYNAGLDVFPNNIVASVTRLGKIDAYFQTPVM